MSDLPILDGAMRSCCIDMIRSYDGPEPEGLSIRCERCVRLLAIRRGRWVWRAEDPLRPTEAPIEPWYAPSTTETPSVRGVERKRRIGNQPLRWRWGDQMEWPPRSDHEQGNPLISAAAGRVTADLAARGGTPLGHLKIVTREASETVAVFQWQLRFDSGQPVVDGWTDVTLAGMVTGTPLEEHYAAAIADGTRRQVERAGGGARPSCPAHADHGLEPAVTLEAGDPIATWSCGKDLSVVLTIGSLGTP